MDAQDESVLLEGTVEEIRFRNEQNGYTVFDIGCDSELVTAVGIFTDITCGDTLTLHGKWDFHPNYGRQLRVDTFERSMPETAEQLYAYLASGAVKGIGPATAEKIIAAFGENTMEILENDPKRLSSVKGISEEKAEKICAEFRRQFAVRSIMMSLEIYNMTAAECITAYKLFGADAVKCVLENPYALCAEGSGIGFERAEAIADGLPARPNDTLRLKAGIIHIVKKNLYDNGHTCIPRDKLVTLAADFLETSIDTADILTDNLCEEKQLVMQVLGTREFIFMPAAYRDEKTISDRMKIMLRFPPPGKPTVSREIDEIEKKDGIHYEAKQREAIETAINKGLLILTGGPGTGKTTTLKGILRMLEKDGLDIALAAPTGRAAKRMSEVTGREAKTIHRLLEVEWDENDRATFKRNLRNPLDCEALILDELSMVDISLFASLLNALPFGCRLILVGDADQLPPVGAGNVLHDLIESGLLPVVELKEVFRQAMDSLIVTNAHRIVRGEMPVLDKKDGDFFLLDRRSPDAAVRTVGELCSTRLPNAYGYSPLGDIQVLCPSRKGETGTINLNRVLQALINPADADKHELNLGFRVFREGDKVMQIKNNYNIVWTKDGESGEGVFNGDIGYIVEINPRSEAVKVQFEDRTAVYMREQLSELEHAYAVTVHKSQGSEFTAVIVPVQSVLPNLRYRNLLYTAVTRAKTLMIMVGSADEIARMVQNDKKTKRFSALRYMLSE